MVISIDCSRINQPKRTGVQWYGFYLLQALAKIDQENKYILYVQNEVMDDLKNLPANFEFKILKWPPRFLWTHIRLSWEMFRNKPEILFIPVHVIPFIHPKKIVFTQHDVAFKYFRESYSKFENFYQDLVLNLARNWATKIIVPSVATKKDCAKFYHVPEDQMKVIEHGFDQEIFHKDYSDEDVAKVLKKHDLQGGKYFFFVSRLEEKKNVVNLIRGFRKADLDKNFKLVLAGKPGDVGYEKIQQEIKWARAEGFKIVELGYVDQADLPLLHRGAIATCVVSWYEGFGMPALEAMACGTPVIGSNLSSIPEVTGVDWPLLVNPNYAEEIGAAMVRLVVEEGLRESLSQQALERVKQFSWEKSARETLRVITKTINSKSPNPKQIRNSNDPNSKPV